MEHENVTLNAPSAERGQPLLRLAIAKRTEERQHGADNRHHRRAGAQSQACGRTGANRQDGGRRGRLRLGQIVARARRALRGRLTPLSGRTLHLHAPAHRTERRSEARRDRACAAGTRAAPAAERAGYPQHFRHDERTAQQPAPHDIPLGQLHLPERPYARPDAECRARTAGHLPGVRRRSAGARRGGPRIQLGRRVPHLLRHGHCAHGGRLHADRRPEPDDRTGCGRAVALAHVVGHGGRVPRDGRAHRRTVQRPHRPRKRDCAARARGKTAHHVPPEEAEPRGRNGLHLLQRRAHRAQCARQSERREGTQARRAVHQRVAMP